MEEKTYVEDIDRSVYDVKDKQADAYRIQEGLTPEIIEQISEEKMILCGCGCSVWSRCIFTRT